MKKIFMPILVRYGGHWPVQVNKHIMEFISTMQMKFQTHESEDLTSDGSASYEWYQVRHIPK